MSRQEHSPEPAHPPSHGHNEERRRTDSCGTQCTTSAYILRHGSPSSPTVATHCTGTSRDRSAADGGNAHCGRAWHRARSGPGGLRRQDVFRQEAQELQVVWPQGRADEAARKRRAPRPAFALDESRGDLQSRLISGAVWVETPRDF